MPMNLSTAGAKGGTGKSTAARFLITYLRDDRADPLLLALDDESRTLSRFFPEALQVEIKKKSSQDILVERALKGNSLIIADLKAGTGHLKRSSGKPSCTTYARSRAERRRLPGACKE